MAEPTIADAPEQVALPKLSWTTQLAFCLAGSVIGVTSTGVNFFILVYYDQVVHLSPSLAGLALSIALIFDGIADPLVGLISDRWQSRLGRRHPFLYASILPMALGYFIVWFPPFEADQQFGLFAYLLIVSVILRLSITLFDVPTNALIPELTANYELRTKFSAAKTSLSWTMANLIGIVMYAFFLRDTNGAGSGLLSKQGYQDAAIWVSGLVLVTTIAVPLSLQRFVPYLRRLGATGSTKPGHLFRSLIETYSNRSILALLLSAIFFAAGVGLTQALWVYFLSFFWALGADQVNAVQLSYLVASLVSLFALPAIARGRDKKNLALILSIVFWANDVLPIALRLVGLFPANGSPWLMPLLCFEGFTDGVLFNMVVSMMLSMLTDVVEDNLLKTGRREEGVVLAGQTLVTKASTALGTLLGGVVLSIVSFPRGPNAAAIPQDVLWRLGAVFVPAIWVLGILSSASLILYRITRSVHAENVQRIERQDAL